MIKKLRGNYLMDIATYKRNGLLIEKIDEIIDAVNRLETHKCPPSDISYDEYMDDCRDLVEE